jgi:hypothetical protein
VICLPIPTVDVATLWPIAEPMISEAIEYSGGRYTIEDLRSDLETGDQQLWFVCDEIETSRPKWLAALTTSFSRYPQMKTLVVVTCGGSDLRRWIGCAEEALLDYARENGCSKIEIYGRPGWERVLRRTAKKALTIFEREVA